MTTTEDQIQMRNALTEIADDILGSVKIGTIVKAVEEGEESIHICAVHATQFVYQIADRLLKEQTDDDGLHGAVVAIYVIDQMADETDFVFDYIVRKMKTIAENPSLSVH